MEISATVIFSKEIRWQVMVSSVFHLLFIFGSLFYSSSHRKSIIITPRQFTVVKLITLPKKKNKKKTVVPKRVVRSKPKPIAKPKRKNKRKRVKKKPRIKKVLKEKKKKDALLEKLKKIEALQKRWADRENEIVKNNEKERQAKIAGNQDIAEKLRKFKEKWAKKKVAAVPLHKELPKSIRIDSPDFSTAYLAILQKNIDGNWVLPVQKPEYRGEKKVVVYFRIYRKGIIKNIEVEKSSGISVLDWSAKKAVINTKYLPPLPDDFRETYLGVHFSFLYVYDD